MTSRPLVLIIPIMLLLLFASAAAQDLNSYTEEELNSYITQLIAEQQSAIPQQPVIVQIKSDEALNQKIELIIAQLGELKNTNDRLQEKFTVMATEFDSKLQGSEERIAARQEAKLDSVTAEQTEALANYIREQTNPIRMNLPSIGVFLMAMAVFLILISRTYDFKGKEVKLVSKKEEAKEEELKKESKKDFDAALERAKEEKAKAENEKALQDLMKAKELINEKIEAVKNA